MVKKQPLHVAIITSGYLPVPNVMGGAVEALDTMLIKENEKHGDFLFTVFSCWTPEAEQAVAEAHYRFTKFVFIKIPAFVRVADHGIYATAKYVLRKRKLMSYRYIAQRLWYIRKVAQKLAKAGDYFDRVVIENHATLFMTMKKYHNSERYSGKVYYHLHNEVLNDYGCLKEIESVKKVLGVSNYIVGTLDEFLKTHGGTGLRDDQKAVWRNGVDAGRFNSPEAQAKGKAFRKQYGIQEDDTVFLFSGRLTQEKGAEELLRAFQQVAKEVPNAKLVIAGAFFFNTSIVSPFEQKLHELATDPAIKDKVIFTGFVDYDDMPGIYAMADICVLPSIWDDPAPLAVIESIVSEKPLITTQSGGIPEYTSNTLSIVLPRDRFLEKNLITEMITLANDKTQQLAIRNSCKQEKRKLTASYFYEKFNNLLH